MNLVSKISQCWSSIQGTLFPFLEEELGPLSKKHQEVAAILELVRVEDHIVQYYMGAGRPPSDRVAIARSLVAKSLYKIGQMDAWRDRLVCDVSLRRLCGFEKRCDIPSTSTFSRANAEFATSSLASIAHESCITHMYEDTIVGHISNDSTAIVCREAIDPVRKKEMKAGAENKKSKKKRGRPSKEEVREEVPEKRIARQVTMSRSELLEDLPALCDVGTKRNSKGHTESWRGYKLHIAVADGDIPISCILTSASMHDSQAAIPLLAMTKERVTNCYDLMDAAYDCDEIDNYSKSLEHVPLIDINPRRNKELKQELAAESKRKKHLGIKYSHDYRYNERSSVERVNSYLKDSFSGRSIWVKGAKKVFSHLMFGILAMTGQRLLRFAT